MTVWIEREPVEDYLNFEPILDKLMKIYGISDIKEWLKPTEKSLHNPYLLNNIKEASEKVLEAIKFNKKICVSYDNDNDGIASGIMMFRYLKSFTNNVVYTYCQRSSGHGISNQFVPEDTQLLIIVDSSTNDIEGCKKYKERGIDIIILDHHPKVVDNPYALIVNPQMDSYPNKELSGGGVVYKFLQVFDELTRQNYHRQFIDLCGIAIYGDVMSMREPENRYFVYHALKNINNPGIKAILQQQKINFIDINSQTIGYKIVPVVNAAARMDKIELIIKLLLEDNYNKCLEIAKECIALNEDRKKEEIKLFTKVKDRIDLQHSIIILLINDKDKIDKGFMGLLAMNIANKYQKPTLVLKNENEICRGSGRSINGIDFKKLLQETGLCDLLEGHSEAFGVNIKANKIKQLYNVIDEKLPIQFIDERNIQYEYDLELDINEIDFNLVRDIQAFNYLSGKDAPYTKVMIRNLPVQERRVIGSNFDTVKISVGKLDLIKFKTNEKYAEELKEGDLIDVIGNLNINRWYNFITKQTIESLQLFLENYRLSS